MSSDTAMQLAGDFPARTHEEWQGLVAAVVNKTRAEDARLDPQASEAALRTELPGGLTIDPIYLRHTASTPLGLPGAMPFTRGRVVRDADGAWDVRQLHDDPDPERTKAAVLDDLEHGVTSIWIHVGPDGVAAGNLDHVLSDVDLALAPVAISAHVAQVEAARALLHILQRNSAATGNLGLDPIGAAARTGRLTEFTDDLGDLTREALATDGRITALTVDSRTYRDAGADAPDEIAYAVATGIDTLRLLLAAGIEPAQAFGQVEFRVSATADQFLTIAWLRALRRLWARVGEVLDVPEANRGARVHAVTSGRMFTRYDAMVNVLRSTLATFGAAVGGADAITVLPYDTALGLPERFSRRLARNTQILLADESNVGRVTDPAGGSWYVEQLTADIAHKAWQTVQEIEAHGGMAKALSDGRIAERIDADRAAEAATLANRRQPITGVSMFPNLDETLPERRPRTPLPTTDTALHPHRDAEPFEALRDRAAAARATGADPCVVIAALGARRDFGARETFVSNLLAAGGVRAVVVEGDAAAVAAEASARHTPVVVLASSPKGYAAHAADMLDGLRVASVDTILVAGRAAELGDRSGDVEGEVRDGMDVVAFLDDLLARLGTPAEGAVQ